RGKALSLTAGYLYYATLFPKFKTDSLKSFSISVWTKILNNGSKRTMLFQLARPGMFTGSINFALNTNAATTVDNLTIQPTFTTVGGGTQDNLNNAIKPKTSISDWTHIMLTYNGNTGVFDIWTDAVKVGGFPNRGVGNNLFKANEPNEIIIGSNYNGIPGKSVSTDVSFAPMTGQLDELRIYNIAVPDAHVKALFNLGKANK
ncbi:MAG TPA: LamG-like jellyroll fold domain-containing protein, partial [Chitinophagaceae bacterium]|nr:LamG-like jellyroll fold domain-containing protein [Chitinophagaceae bacterium]